MADYIVTGKKGGGKTLIAVARIADYLRRGKPVATNLDLKLEHLLPSDCPHCNLIRLPDKPTIEDLRMIGAASTTCRESDNGLIVLDELGTWFNARTYNDKGRQEVVDWLIHSRKLQWDLYLIVQHLDLLDKQARITINEHIVMCRRTDRLNVPLVGMIFKFLTSKKLPLPQIHVAIVFYGQGLGAVRVDTWVYRGHNFYKAYDTNQIFKDDYKHGPHSYLPPYPYLTWTQKAKVKQDGALFMRLTKIYWRRLSRPISFVMGVLFLAIVAYPFFRKDNAAAFIQNKSSSQVMQQKNVVPGRIDPPLDVPKNQITGDIEQKEVVKPEENVKPAMLGDLRRLNYVIYRQRMTIYYNRVAYTPLDFPYPIEWKRGEPYMRLPKEV